MMWKGFGQAQGWQYLSTEYCSHDTEVHILKMYEKQPTGIIQGKVFAFKIVTLAPPSTIKSVKSISHISFKGKDALKIKTEILALQKMKNYGAVAQLYQVLSDGEVEELLEGFIKKPRRKGRSVGLVLQYCPFMSLKYHISNHRPTQTQIISIGIQIFECLMALKQCQILHRDLRSTNLMLGKDSVIKLIDFDCAFIRGVSDVSSLTYAFSESCTASQVIQLINSEQQTKELVTSEEIYAKLMKCDIYSFGTVLYEMITRQEFNQQHGNQLLNNSNFSEELKKFVTLLLKASAQRLNHKQTEAYLTFLAERQNLEYRPQKRRKYTRQQQLTLPNIETPSSHSSQSITNSISLSDWSLNSSKDFPQQFPTSSTAKQIQRTTTISEYIFPHHKTINE